MRNLSVLAFRNLWVRRARTVLTALGITFGVAVVVAMLVADESTMQALVDLFAGISDRASLVVQASGSSINTFDPAVLQDIQSYPGVKAAAPIAYKHSSFVYQGEEQRVRLTGVDPVLDQEIRTYKLASGNFLAPNSDTYDVVITRVVADEFDFRLGDTVEIAVPEGTQAFRVVGILENEGPAQIDYGYVFFIDLNTAGQVLDLDGQISQVDVVLPSEIEDSTEKLEQFKDDLQAYLGDQYVVAYPSTTGQELVNAMNNFRMGLSTFVVIALFMGALLIYNTFAINALERTREHGLLRAVGSSRWQVLRLNLSEALFLGLLASVAGLGLGMLISLPLTNLMGFSILGWFRADFIVSPGALVIGLIVGIVVSLLAALRPAWIAGRISPVEAFRIQGVKREGWVMRHAWQIGLACWALLVLDIMINFLPPPIFGLIALAGTFLLIPGTIMLMERVFRKVLGLIYGSAGQLGSRNLQRSKGRVSLITGVMSVGVILLVSVGAMAIGFRKTLSDWSDKAIAGDFYITSNYGRPEIGDEIARVEGVKVVTPMTLVSAKALGASDESGFRPHSQQISIRAIDPATYRSVSSFYFAEAANQSEQIFEQFARGGTVLITPNLQKTYGLQRGDKLRLRTAEGEQDFEVAGVIVDMYSGGQVVVLSREDLHTYFHETRVLYFVVKLSPDTSAEAVEPRLEEVADRHHLAIFSTQAFRYQMRKQYDNIMSLLNVVVAIVIVMSAVGLMNTISISVTERMHEFGILRSLGMFKTQVLKMVLGEAAAIGVIGAAFGVVAGLAVSFMMILGMNEGMGWKIDYVFPIGYVILGLLLSFIMSQLAALYSAWRAMRLNPTEAIRHE